MERNGNGFFNFIILYSAVLGHDRGMAMAIRWLSHAVTRILCDLMS